MKQQPKKEAQEADALLSLLINETRPIGVSVEHRGRLHVRDPARDHLLAQTVRDRHGTHTVLHLVHVVLCVLCTCVCMCVVCCVLCVVCVCVCVVCVVLRADLNECFVATEAHTLGNPIRENWRRRVNHGEQGYKHINILISKKS